MKVYKFTGQINTTYLGYKKLLNFYIFSRRIKDDIISLDFYDLSWIDANMSVILQAMMHKLFNENNLTFSTDANYLKSQFPILFKNGFAWEIDKLPDTYGTTIELTQFEFGKDDEKFKDYIKNDLMGHRGLECLDKKIANQIRGNLFEIYCNIEHSKSVEVYACGQYFPNKKVLKFTLLDLGVGYLKPINNKHKEIETHSNAIEWAIQEGNTTRVGVPGGGGLPDIIEYFDTDDKGKFEIITGNAYWTSLSTFPIRKMKNIFCGTIINLVFNLE